MLMRVTDAVKSLKVSVQLLRISRARNLRANNCYRKHDLLESGPQSNSSTIIASRGQQILTRLLRCVTLSLGAHN